MKPMPKSDKLLDVVLNLTPEDIQKILSKLNTKEEKREFDFLISQYAKNTLRKIKQKFSIPKIYRDIFGDEAAKYIVLKGGRGSGKTFAIICYMLEQSFEEKYSDSLFLVLREIQTSIEDSVHSVVSDLIKQAGLEQYFKITHSKIINKLTNVEFAFTGLRSTAGKTAFSQVNKIKGKHKVRMVFMDEAQDASQDSLDVLFPTVNRSGNVSFTSEYERLLRLAFGAEEVDLTEARFFFAMNPNFAEDPVITKVRAFGDQAVIKHINIFDLPNRYQDTQLLEQAKRERGEVTWPHVWLGEPSPKISGYPFAETPVVTAEENEELLPCVAFLDPSYKGGDFTALSFVSQTRGYVFAWGYCFPHSWNSAIDQIAEKINLFPVVEFYYEDNGVGTAPQDYFSVRGIDAIPRTTLGNKHDRIFRVGAFLNLMRLRLVENWSNQEWLTQHKKFNKDAEHDDAPDATTNCAVRSGIVSDKIKIRGRH
ncbi:TPA: phage terminase large subunit [Vibrio parahaemolyticus]|nr:phage terminase large subunit [Vibrio parahaemolyticus]MDF5315642.1 phage terminase large subunit [Vibrio parahaemolyticus]MDF5339906.1 phage terminase large subunit [Vibrio parahaemolyticus]MDF5350166.1 phage terminase large subunit [Vibrio parahaemolyticus]MDF5461945.1 phage terminase large subunit [Vibrio parahaemolyticus]